MKLRLIAAAALVPVLLVVLFVAPKVLTAVVVGILCAIAAYELLCGTGLVKHARLVAYTMIYAFLVPIWVHFGMNHYSCMVGILLFACLLFMEIILSGAKLRFDRIAVCLVAGLIIPYMLSSLVRIMDSIMGRYLILIPFILAFMSDTGAYFIGCRWGKHKLAPVISPNKSVEGMVGGLATVILSMLVYCLVISVGFRLEVNYFYGILYGLVGGLAGVFGDLCFSAVKRQTGIKDYGKLIPGHGGALDRFDSMVVVAPIAEILLIAIPVVN